MPSARSREGRGMTTVTPLSAFLPAIRRQDAIIGSWLVALRGGEEDPGGLSARERSHPPVVGQRVHQHQPPPVLVGGRRLPAGRPPLVAVLHAHLHPVLP